MPDRHYVVTGAASGIGAAVTDRMVADGARVSAWDLRATARRDQVAPMEVDVTDETSVETALRRSIDANGPVHGLVASAGVQLFGRDAPVHELSLDAWNATVSVNLTGVFLTCRAIVRHLLEAGRPGSIVLIGSPTARRGMAAGTHAYSSAKGGVMSLVTAMATRYARNGVRVNAVVPGITETPLIADRLGDSATREQMIGQVPMDRPGDPNEVASVIAFLLSDAASYVTGSFYDVDGGLLAK